MTEQELRNLDAELDNGTMDEEQYCATLRDEVARIHPDYDPCTIENMICMQLRIEALESVLAEDVTESDLPDAGGVIEAAGARKEGDDKPGFKEDDKDSQIKALLQKLKEKAEKQVAEQKAGKPDLNEEQGTAKKPGQQKLGIQDGQQNCQDQQPDQKESSQHPQNGTQSKSIPNSSPNGQMQDQNNEHSDQQQNDQNKQNGKDGQSQQDQSKQDQSQ